MYQKVIADSEREEDLVRKALGKIYEIRNIRHERRIQVNRNVVALLHAADQNFESGETGGEQGNDKERSPDEDARHHGSNPSTVCQQNGPDSSPAVRGSSR